MSCSKQSAVNYLVDKGLVKENMELYAPLPSARLMETIDHLTKLAKSKYDVNMGSLFKVRYRDVTVGNYLIEGSRSVVTKVRLEANDNAFEAIDKSKQAQENKTKQALEDYQNRILPQREYEAIQKEGNFTISEDGDVVVPNSLPKINVRC